ncbi:hypothetical protein ACLOJK_030698 [Asimina triloba]
MARAKALKSELGQVRVKLPWTHKELESAWAHSPPSSSKDEVETKCLQERLSMTKTTVASGDLDAAQCPAIVVEELAWKLQAAL